MRKMQEIATPLSRLAMTSKWDSNGLNRAFFIADFQCFGADNGTVPGNRDRDLPAYSAGYTMPGTKYYQAH